MKMGMGMSYLSETLRETKIAFSVFVFQRQRKEVCVAPCVLRVTGGDVLEEEKFLKKLKKFLASKLCYPFSSPLVLPPSEKRYQL